MSGHLASSAELIIIPNSRRTAVRHRMNTHRSVEVYLGNTITVPSEQAFLARLRKDLQRDGVAARILANVLVGRDGRQLDFLIITDQRAVHTELKTFPGPILDAPRNGPWSVRVGVADVREHGNPARQAIETTYALSDALHAFAARVSAPGPTNKRFYRDIDTVVCAFPAVAAGSHLQTYRFVDVVGYDQLLQRLTEPGPAPAWSSADWDAFGQHLNVYREEDDSPEGLVRLAGSAEVDAYRGRFLHAHRELPPLVPTAVYGDDRPVPRPDLQAELSAGRAVLVHGPSGSGKTLWAQHTAAQLARNGQLPIWLAGDVSEEKFRTSAARAIAPYTSLSLVELLRAAEVAGAGVLFVLDDMTRTSETIRRALIRGVQTARVRDSTCGLLLTAQDPDAASSVPGCTTVQLDIPSADERRAVLSGYGAGDLVADCDGFSSALELSLAAACAGELRPDASPTDLVDRYVERVLDGDDRPREHLRVIAEQMHNELRPSLSRQAVVQILRRDCGVHGDALQALLDSPLLSVGQGRVAFRHERFEHFFAAEALILNSEPAYVARSLNSPQGAGLHRDAIALEQDENRVIEMLSVCERDDVLVDAALGRLGGLAARVTEALLVDALNVACAVTASPGITFHARHLSLGEWQMPEPISSAVNAQLAAVGRLLHTGRLVEGTVRLFDLTDALCVSTAAEDDHCLAAIEDEDIAARMRRQLADLRFGAAYATGPAGLPARTVIEAAAHARWGRGGEAPEVDVATALLDASQPAGIGVLNLATRLMHWQSTPSQVMPDVIIGCLDSRIYHARLEALMLVHDRAWVLEGEDRDRVLEAVRAVETNNLALSSAVVEALSRLGDITPAKTVEDIEGEIAMALEMRDDPIGRKLAYGIVCGQFENEVIGPYYQAVSETPPAERERLLVMALAADDTTGLYDDWILNEIDDLSHPDTRAAVIDWVAGFDPTAMFGPLDSLKAVIAALALLVHADLPIPKLDDSENRHPAWPGVMTLLAGAMRGDSAALEQAWMHVLVEHPDILASLLVRLRRVDRAGRRGPEDIRSCMLGSMPPAGVAVLIWTLDHPSEAASLFQGEFQLQRDVVQLLWDLGDPRARDVLRRLAGDPDVGELAAAAARAIESGAGR